jgi:hypothetical protein
MIAQHKTEVAAFTVDSYDEALECLRTFLRTHLTVTVECHTSPGPTFWLIQVWQDAPAAALGDPPPMPAPPPLIPPLYEDAYPRYQWYPWNPWPVTMCKLPTIV